jgi:signal transduction histidine kinase
MKEYSGIGLHITKAIIEEKFGGKIRARNSKEGLLFLLQLPLHLKAT